MKSFQWVYLFLVVLGLSTAAQAKNGPINCYIQTYNGRYLTAVGGGGRIQDVLHSDAVRPQAWERFTLEDSGKGTPNITYGIKTVKGFYLTALGGGGQIQDVMHSDATVLRDWEEFQMISLGGGYFAIQSYRGNYLTAVGGGGRITDVVHSDATRIGNWEKFRLTCGVK
jgi:hypothetical protein